MMRDMIREETMKLYNESDVWKEYIDELMGIEEENKEENKEERLDKE